MAVETEDIYFSGNPLTVSATITGVTGTVDGFYERATAVDVGGGRVPMTGYKPTLTVRASLKGSISVGADVAITGVSDTYKVAHPDQIDEFQLMLILEKQ